MDSSINERMVPRILMCLFIVFCVVLSSKIFPIFLAVTFPPLSPFGFQCCICLLYVVVVQFSHFPFSHIVPTFPFWFAMSFFLPFLVHTHSLHFSLLVFKVFFLVLPYF